MSSLLEAGKLLKNENIKWIFLGDGRKLEWFKKKIIKEKIEGCFDFPGQFPAKDMPQFFAKADIFLLSLKKDKVFEMTIPGKLQSYLAYGKPIVTMADGEASKIVEISKSGLIAGSGQYRKLSSNILKLKNIGIKKRSIMEKNAKLFAIKFFKIESAINIFENIIFKSFKKNI